MQEESARPDFKVAQIAVRQHGVVTSAQLRRAGITRSGITRRIRAGRLHRLHRGIYAVGHANLTREGRWLAAVLACGEGAVLSHASAGALWKISPPTSPSSVDVTVPGSNGREKRPGIVVHRSGTLTRGDMTRLNGIPVTTRARTLRDLGYGPEPTRSELERMFLRLCRKQSIPKPEVNVSVGPYTVDFLWREHALIVETDGYRYHSSPASFESDRARDRELMARGYTVLRFTYREVTEKPATVIASLQAHLHRRMRRQART